mmetsp:Transcript_22909/g.45666  ORF Transcript_22909/g.45666 Transcript_22909/m.45666 type:complete len:360 (+) Transcript_22909:243-1322(+)
MDAAQNKPMSIFAVIKLARSLRSFRYLLSPHLCPPTDTRLMRAIRRVMGACALVSGLRSLDRKQMEAAIAHVAKMCRMGPASLLILQDAGCVPVLVELLRLEGGKNEVIVGKALYTIHVMCLERGPCEELVAETEITERLEQLYKSENAIFKRLAAGIICRLFNQLSNTGHETPLVCAVRSGRRTSSLVAAPRDPNDPSSHARDSMSGLLVRLLDSSTDSIVKDALFTLDELTHHFENTIALCEMREPALLPRLTDLLKRTDVEVVRLSSTVVSNIVCNCRLHRSVLAFARSGDLLGQLRATMEFIANEGGGSDYALGAAKEAVHSSMFDMYCSLPMERRRYHGPEAKREETLLKEANR